MSAPARKLQEPSPRRTPARGKPNAKPKPSPTTTHTRTAPPVRTTAAHPRPTSPPQPRVRARRGFHLAFWIFSASVISMIVVGVVALNAMVVNTTYRMESAQRTLDDLRTEQASLSTEVARLSSPSRIAEWAASVQLVPPQDVVVLPVAGVRAGR